MTPWAVSGHESADFMTALFTTVSASCVTGLTVQDTATFWSPFGQLVLLLLIQVGGLGVVTMAVALTMASGRRIGLMQRNTMQDALSVPQLGGIVRILRFILLFTFGTELLGAVLLLPVFVRDYGWGQGAWMALFHSVSAFCNAGFDLMAGRDGGSLMAYQSDPLVNGVIILLIIAGGLGFITWADLRVHGLRFQHYSLQTKIILVMTVGLIVVPALMLFFNEFAADPLGTRIMESLFQAVTPRTAGYNTVDIESISEPGRIVLVVLMLTGGAPGSTAGGIKITTAFALAATAWASLHMRRDVECFQRRLSPENCSQALTIFLLYLLLFAGSTFFISVWDHVSVVDGMVETASALGTVGLSIGLTEHLSTESQLVLSGLMFFGRVGALTMIYAMHRRQRPVRGRMPEEKITVG